MSDVIKGKKVTEQADAIAGDIKGLRKSGAGLQKDAVKNIGTIGQAVQTDTVRAEKLARAGEQDALRQARQLSAQRGLAGTSIGLGLETDANRNMIDRLNDIRGSIGERTRREAENRINIGSNLIAQGGPIRMQSTTSRRGGLGGVLGTAVGGAFGGPMGAKIGGSIGGALQNS